MLHIPHKVEVLLQSEAQLAERKKGVVLWVVVEEGVGQLVLSLAGKKSVNGTIRKKKPSTHRDKKIILQQHTRASQSMSCLRLEKKSANSTIREKENLSTTKTEKTNIIAAYKSWLKQDFFLPHLPQCTRKGVLNVEPKIINFIKNAISVCLVLTLSFFLTIYLLQEAKFITCLEFLN